MKSRIQNVMNLLPDAVATIQKLHTTIEPAGLPPETLRLVHMRASQINGCGFCLDLDAQRAGSEKRLHLVAAWRHTPYFTDAERAALALTEAVTRIADREDPVPDAVWNEAARHYDEKQLAALLVAIATVNVWNRLNVATAQIAGSVRW